MLRLEKLVRPRGVAIAGHVNTIRASGIMIAILGFLLSLPYPPGTNWPPAFAIILFSVGLLEEDTLFIAAGIVAFLLNLVLFTAVTFYGIQGFRWITNWLF